LRSEIHKLIGPICNKDELSGSVEGAYYVTNSQEGRKTECSNYYGLSLLSTSYKIVSSILLSRLSPYI
jgi:hypothetical protein